jgi:hypothetical protein
LKPWKTTVNPRGTRKLIAVLSWHKLRMGGRGGGEDRFNNPPNTAAAAYDGKREVSVPTRPNHYVNPLTTTTPTTSVLILDTTAAASGEEGEDAVAASGGEGEDAVAACGVEGNTALGAGGREEVEVSTGRKK